MAFASDEVRYVAELARLHLTDEEIKRFASQLGEILKYVEKLQKLDTKDVAPADHVLPVTDVFREDEVQASLPPKSALSNAPEADGAFFKVPRVIEDV